LEPAVDTTEYKNVLLFLATAAILVPLFQRFRISPVLGFLTAGAALGPYGLGSLADEAPWLASFTISEAEQFRVLGEFGVVFLLFMIGLELSWERLRSMRRLVFGLGLLQVAVCAIVLGAAVMLLGRPLGAAAAIGAALSLSSTAIVTQVLAERRRLQTPAGRASFSVLLAQDIAVAPLLFTVMVLAGGGEGNIGRDLVMTLAPALAGVLLLVAVGRLVFRRMMRSVARTKSQELFMAACLLVIILSGLVSAAAGLSMAIGAFIAGLLLAETEYRREVETVIEPFKGLLLGLFFVSVGLQLDLSQVVERPGAILGIGVALVAIKIGVIFGLARAFGVATRPALETALVLGPAGEFAFVILSAALADGLVDRTAGSAVLVSATLSMFAIPLLTMLGARINRREESNDVAQVQNTPGPEDPDRPLVLIAGFGRVGRLVSDMLSRHEVAWVAVDNDAKVVEQARAEGVPIWFGDAGRAEFLKRCGVETAPALVVTMDAAKKVEDVVTCARALRPDLTIVARARDHKHAARLYELGVTDAVPETIEASLQLAENALVDIGIPMGPVIASIHERRDEFRRLFREKTEGDREPRALRPAGTAAVRD
jgi:CPA2 family monovalent cation:H+ antiporter-2